MNWTHLTLFLVLGVFVRKARKEGSLRKSIPPESWKGFHSKHRHTLMLLTMAGGAIHIALFNAFTLGVYCWAELSAAKLFNPAVHKPIIGLSLMLSGILVVWWVMAKDLMLYGLYREDFPQEPFTEAYRENRILLFGPIIAIYFGWAIGKSTGFW